MEKSDLMRVLMESLFRKKPEPKKPSSPEPLSSAELKDHIFKSNQSFQIVRKRIVKRRD